MDDDERDALRLRIQEVIDANKPWEGHPAKWTARGELLDDIMVVLETCEVGTRQRINRYARPA